VSVGHPFNSSGSEARASDALKLARLGGTYELYANASANDTYWLVGAASPGGGLPPYRAAETGSLEPGNLIGPLRGVLGREHRGNFFSPVASASQQTNFDFYSILAQKPIFFSFRATPLSSGASTISADYSVTVATRETGIGTPTSISMLGNPRWREQGTRMSIRIQR